MAEQVCRYYVDTLGGNGCEDFIEENFNEINEFVHNLSGDNSFEKDVCEDLKVRLGSLGGGVISYSLRAGG